MDGRTQRWVGEPTTADETSVSIFLLGKLAGFMTFFTFFVNLVLAKWLLIVYAIFIGISILLSAYQMFRPEKQVKKPTKEQVEEWAIEYKLLEGR